MKRFLSFILYAALLVCLCSCTNNPDAATAINTKPQTAALCESHTITDNTCAVCNASVWDGTKNTIWYSKDKEAYDITDAAQLAGLKALVDNGESFNGVTLTLKNHIDLGGLDWSTIGSFGGVFDGNGYTISNYVINTAGQANALYVGFFGNVRGTLKNVVLKDFYINVTTNYHNDNTIANISAYIGGLAGFCIGDTVNCHVSGVITQANEDETFNTIVYVGGLFGYSEGDIFGCSSDISIVTSKEDYVGGLIGGTTSPRISESYATGLIRSDSAYTTIGGLIGESSRPTYDVPTNATIDTPKTTPTYVNNCYSNINIVSFRTSVVGGIVGQANSTTKINSCYSTGMVSICGGVLSGIVGKMTSSEIHVNNCFTAIETELLDLSVPTVCSIIPDDSYTYLERCFYSDNMMYADYLNGSYTYPESFVSADFFLTKLLWKDSIWNFVDGEYPTLKYFDN